MAGETWKLAPLSVFGAQDVLDVNALALTPARGLVIPVNKLVHKLGTVELCMVNHLHLCLSFKGKL